MTSDETIGLLAAMVAAWPSMEIHPAATDLWIRHVADVGVEDARAAFDRLVKSDQWPPTIARFREVAKALAPLPEMPVLLPARLPKNQALAHLAEAREALRRGQTS